VRRREKKNKLSVFFPVLLHSYIFEDSWFHSQTRENSRNTPDKLRSSSLIFPFSGWEVETERKQEEVMCSKKSNSIEIMSSFRGFFLQKRLQEEEEERASRELLLSGRNEYTNLDIKFAWF
jgi:hypothetical protein